MFLVVEDRFWAVYFFTMSYRGQPLTYIFNGRGFEEVSGMCQQTDLELIQKIRSGSEPAAKETLVEKYLPMVRHIVRNQNTPSADFEDFLQEGAVGLLKAIDQYDYLRYRIKFSTFAYICILRRIYNKIKQNYTKKALFEANSLSLNYSVDAASRQLIQSVADLGEEPFVYVERDWMANQLKAVLKAYLSPLEYDVVLRIIWGYSLGEIQEDLKLPAKVIDNARTRSRLKLKKVIMEYGSLLSPKIPLKTRKRHDLTLALRKEA